MPYELRSRNHSGFSLIEVIASLMLTGTLLVMILMAHQATAHQSRMAQNRLVAIAALDDFLIQYFNPAGDERSAPGARGGTIPGNKKLRWRIVEAGSGSVAPITTSVLRMEVFDPDFENGATLAWVEVLTADANSKKAIQ